MSKLPNILATFPQKVANLSLKPFLLSYKFPTAENLVSIYAFDFNGSMVKKIIDNQLCGTNGMYFWDGLDQNKRKVRPGFYIIFTEAIDLRGIRKVIKKMIGVM